MAGGRGSQGDTFSSVTPPLPPSPVGGEAFRKGWLGSSGYTQQQNQEAFEGILFPQQVGNSPS